MSDEEIKRLILARRAAFIAATVASLAATECGPKESDPGPCLSAPYNPDQRPQVCLSVPQTFPPDADAPDASSTPVASAEPQPCLSPMVPPQDASAPSPLDASKPPPPQVCLTPPKRP